MCIREEKQMDEVLTTALAALDAGLVSSAQIRRANAWRRKTHPQLGKLAMAEGKLTVAEVFDVLGHQAVEGGLFGQVAINLGFMNEKDLFELLEVQQRLTPTLADALVALEFVSTEQMSGLLGNERSPAPRAASPTPAPGAPARVSAPQKHIAEESIV